MKGLGTIATLFLIIAAAGAVVSVLQLAIVALVLIALITQPRATLTFFASIVTLGFVANYPWIMLPIIVFGTVGGTLKARQSEPKIEPVQTSSAANDAALHAEHKETT